MIFSLTGAGFVAICSGMGGLFTYMGIEKKYKLVNKKDIGRILEEEFGVIRKSLEEEAATVNSKIAELQDENSQFINLITELTERNEVLEKLVEKKESNKRKKKVITENEIDNIIELHAESIAQDYEAYIPLPEEEIPTNNRKGKKNKQ